MLFSAYPSRVNFSIYDSLAKKPDPDFNNIVAGVCPLNTDIPFLFVICTFAPTGVDFTVKGQELELTIEAQLLKTMTIAISVTGLKILFILLLIVYISYSLSFSVTLFNFQERFTPALQKGIQ